MHNQAEKKTKHAKEEEEEVSTLRVLRRVAYFQELSTAALQALAASAIRSQYAAGVIIFGEGEPTTGIHIIEEGSVKVSRFAKDGREQILNIFHQGDTFNDVSALDGGPNPATATAFSDVVVWQISRPALQRVTQAHPEVAWALIGSIASRTRYLVGLVEDLAIRSVKGRLAQLLLEQVNSSQNMQIPRDMTQEEIANRLGTVREMIGRTLQRLALNGIIQIERHHITVLDVERLADEADG